MSLSYSNKMSLSYSNKQNGLICRQADFNIPTYRIIPYKSTICPNPNDYYLNTILQLKQQVRKLNKDYRNLCEIMWKVFAEIDRVEYDRDVGFSNVDKQSIYQRISLLRKARNIQQVDQLLEEESLKLSAIYRVDQTHQYPQIAISNDKQFKISTNNNSFKNFINISQTVQNKTLDEIKHESLYQIQQQQQLQTTNPNCIYPQQQLPNKRLTIHRKQSIKQQKQAQVHRRSLSSHKPRRSSILLKEKISLAFHQQQELRQILQQELESLVKELNQKNQCLRWTVEELEVRNQFIYQLRNTLVQRDLLVESKLIHTKQQQTHQKLKYLQVHQQLTYLQANHQQQQIQHTNSQQKIQQHNMKIGNLINCLIQRTQQTYDDFQYLMKSLTINQNISQQKLQINQSQLINDVNDIEQRVAEECLDNSLDKSLHLKQIFQEFKVNNSHDGIFMIQMISPDKQDNHNSNVSRVYHEKYNNLQQQPHQKTNQECILQQTNMNTANPKSKVVLLTKQHFLNAQKKYPKSPKDTIMLKNVQMTKSLQGDENLL